jgi:hypothetical protein
LASSSFGPLVMQQQSKFLYSFPDAALYTTLNVTHRPLMRHMLAISSSTGPCRALA